MRKMFLAMLAILILFAPNVEAASAKWRNEPVSDTFAQEVLYYVNFERNKNNLPALTLASDLNKYAQIRAKEITKKFSHIRPNGSDCFTVVRGYYRHLGENIAAGQSSAKAVVIAWLKSPTHRANILDARFKEMGIGYVYAADSKYKHFWAQFFRQR